MNLLLVDDHRLMRDGVRALLEQEHDLHVVGEAADGRSAVELAEKLRPDLVLMDITMPGLSGVEATRGTKDHALIADFCRAAGVTPRRAPRSGS